jgi:uncharacterized repeat protein (TIGR03803 family)
MCRQSGLLFRRRWRIRGELHNRHGGDRGTITMETKATVLQFALLALLAAGCGARVARAQLSGIYDFGSYATDGVTPNGDLVQWTDGGLFGTTQGGGDSKSCGTVFEVSLNGGEVFSASFKCAPNYAVEPHGGLAIGANGDLYGATWYGNADALCCVGGCGGPVHDTANACDSTVFRASPSGAIAIIARPPSTLIGQPVGKLVPGPDGALYGAAQEGGSGCGTIFKVGLNGTFTVVANLGGSFGPCTPLDSLTLGSDGNFYGTTKFGGKGGCALTPAGCGTVFQVTTAGALKTLLSFYAPTGDYPAGALALGPGGTLFGTTSLGGTANVGTAYSITTQGGYQVLENLVSSTNGEEPGGRLLRANDGNFYGVTTLTAPPATCTPLASCDTVFRLTPSGVFTTVFTFLPTTLEPIRGPGPTGGLIQGIDGCLYGTTRIGGVYGNGTVFRLDLGLKPLLPEVASFSPSSGPTGTTVTVRGQYFVQVQSVTFTGGVSATFTPRTPSEITVVVPSGAATGPLEITTSAGSSKSKGSFTVN